MKSPLAPAPLSPVGRAMRQVADTLTPERFHRMREAFMGSAYEADDVKAAVELLTRAPAAPVVLMATGSKNAYPDHRLATVLRHPNVRTAGIALPEMLGAFERPRDAADGLKTAALLSIRLTIRHDLGHALRGSTQYDKAALLLRARRELSLSGADDDVIGVVMAESALPPPSDHWDAEAAFVDWDGTLNGETGLDLPLLEKIRGRAGALPVSVWTGGDVEAVYATLRGAGVNDVHVASKHDSRGMRARLAVDDESPDELAKAYGIAMHDLIDVRTLLS